MFSRQFCINSTLRWLNFLDHNSRDRIPSTVGICIGISLTITNIETNIDSTLIDVATISLDMTMTMNILCSFTFPYVVNTFNCRITFFSIEFKIPSPATPVAAVNTEVAGVKHAKIGAVTFFLKTT